MFPKYKRLQVVLVECTLSALLGTSLAVHAQGQSAPSSSTSSTQQDNSARNKSQRKTAEQQSEGSSDRQTTAKIRRAIVGDKSLSTYGHNVKIITQSGAVTLKGPVHSEEEKKTITSKAAEIVGQDKVTDQLTVKQ